MTEEGIMVFHISIKIDPLICIVPEEKAMHRPAPAVIGRIHLRGILRRARRVTPVKDARGDVVFM